MLLYTQAYFLLCAYDGYSSCNSVIVAYSYKSYNYYGEFLKGNSDYYCRYIISLPQSPLLATVITSAKGVCFQSCWFVCLSVYFS